MYTLITVLLFCAGVGAWIFFSMPYTDVKAYVNGLAPDGNVETFTMQRYAAAQVKGRLIGTFVGLVAFVLHFAKRKVAPGRKRSGSFLVDSRAGLQKLFKHTSKNHLYTVLGIILVGAAMRFAMLFEPLIYDEAFTYTYFAVRPLFVAVSDYSYPNNHIFHTLLIKLSCSIFGVGLVPLRLPAFLAGVLCMPLFYVFTRAMFNRYIAMMALAVVAGTGGLIEYSALARGYSITWLCMLLGLLLVRHLVKSNSASTAVFLALVNAIGMWTVPTMIYMSLFLYVSSVLLVISKYETTLKERVLKLVLSFVLFLVFTAVLYSPVVIMNSVDQLFYHPTMGESVWDGTATNVLDRVAEILVYWSYSTHAIITFVGVLCLLFAGYISSKFRVLLFATVLGIVPLVAVQGVIGPARVWNFVHFVYAIGIGIALFYALKFIQEHVFSWLQKRMRTLVTSGLILIVIGVISMNLIHDRYKRFHEAEHVAMLIGRSWNSGDLILSDFPWKAPIHFHLLANGTGAVGMFERPESGKRVFLIVSPTSGQTTESVLNHHRMAATDLSDLEKMIDQGRCELFLARYE